MLVASSLEASARLLTCPFEVGEEGWVEVDIGLVDGIGLVEHDEVDELTEEGDEPDEPESCEGYADFEQPTPHAVASVVGCCLGVARVEAVGGQ